MRIYKTLLPINICYFIFSYFYKFHVFSFYLKKLHRVNYHNSCGYLENEKVIPGTSININQCFCEYGKKRIYRYADCAGHRKFGGGGQGGSKLRTSEL